MAGRIVDVIDFRPANPPLRDVREFMVSPITSVQKKPVYQQMYDGRRYRFTVVAPPFDSIATLSDYSIIIAILSYLNDVHQQSGTRTRVLRFLPHQLLQTMRWGTGQNGYQRLGAAITRLSRTNICADERLSDLMGVERSFNLLAGYQIPIKYQDNAYRHAYFIKPSWEVEIPGWMHDVILDKRRLLAIHPAYFRLGNTLDRALYRIARKSVKADRQFFSLRAETIQQMAGYTSSKSKFASMLKAAALRNAIPEYRISMTKNGADLMVTFSSDHSKPGRPIRGLIDENGCLARIVKG